MNGKEDSAVVDKYFEMTELCLAEKYLVKKRLLFSFNLARKFLAYGTEKI